MRVVGGGCAGFSYDLYFEDKVGDMDEQFESQGVKLYVDPMSYQYLEGVEIDYIEGLHGAGFKFNNPNSKGSCGCGSSFRPDAIAKGAVGHRSARQGLDVGDAHATCIAWRSPAMPDLASAENDRARP